ncbi:hypothetical protein GJ496_008693 [Pomphorhynchus laevis]|nr:hypothetical protein GJ496_008693 [Pomphorhynchus laevis]
MICRTKPMKRKCKNSSNVDRWIEAVKIPRICLPGTKLSCLNDKSATCYIKTAMKHDFNKEVVVDHMGNALSSMEVYSTIFNSNGSFNCFVIEQNIRRFGMHVKESLINVEKYKYYNVYTKEKKQQPIPNVSVVIEKEKESSHIPNWKDIIRFRRESETRSCLVFGRFSQSECMFYAVKPMINEIDYI